MIRVLVAFPMMGSLCTRWVASMKRYLPDDVVITQVLNKHIAFNKEPYDIVVTLRGAGKYLPFQGLASPKAIWSEELDNVMLSFLTDKDLMIIYDYDKAAQLREAGYNVKLLPPPINSETFYPELWERDIEILSVDVNVRQYIIQVDELLDELGLKHLATIDNNFHHLELKAELDYCYVPQDNDRMRYNYSRSKYVMSLLPDYEYMPGQWCRGWESGNVEGLFCGARPIIFKPQKTKYYNVWLDEFAITVDINNFKEELRTILTGEYWQVTQEEIDKARGVFSAGVVWAEFWQAVREVLQ